MMTSWIKTTTWEASFGFWVSKEQNDVEPNQDDHMTSISKHQKKSDWTRHNTSGWSQHNRSSAKAKAEMKWSASDGGEQAVREWKEGGETGEKERLDGWRGLRGTGWSWEGRGMGSQEWGLPTRTTCSWGSLWSSHSSLPWVSPASALLEPKQGCAMPRWIDSSEQENVENSSILHSQQDYWSTISWRRKNVGLLSPELESISQLKNLNYCLVQSSEWLQHVEKLRLRISCPCSQLRLTNTSTY